MAIQSFKQYSTIVDGGTGVLFQPMTDEYFYILTTKHNLQNIQGDGSYLDKEENSKIEIIRFICEDDNWSFDIIPFLLIKGQNYFPHSNDNVDIAILKITFAEYKEIEINNLYVSDKTNINNDTYLCGFPKDKRDINDGDYQMQFTNYDILRNTNDSEFANSVYVNGNHTQDTIIGMSGGGIVKIKDDKYELIGIQSQFTKTISDQSEIDFIPIKFFDDIIKEYSQSLVHMLPPYMASFEYLKNEILKLEEIIPELKPKLKNAISEQLSHIDTNPFEICNNSILNKLLTKNALENNSNSKIFWSSCLEYLVILSLLKDKVIDIDSLLELIDEKRLIHSDTDLSWIEILPEILNSNIKDLKDDSILIVSTKKAPSGKKRLNTAYIRDIADPQIDFTIDRAESINKIKEIIHIKAVEIDCFIHNENSLNEFKPAQIKELIVELKKLVNEFLEN